MRTAIMQRRQFQGMVISNASVKTLTVSVSTVAIHPIYRKRMKRRTRYHVHCEQPSQYAIGSSVLFEECRPMSKTKRWRVVDTTKSSKSSEQANDRA